MQAKNLRSLDQEDLLEEEMATHSSILAWEIPWKEEPGGLQSIGVARVRQDLAATPSPPSFWWFFSFSFSFFSVSHYQIFICVTCKRTLLTWSLLANFGNFDHRLGVQPSK